MRAIKTRSGTKIEVFDQPTENITQELLEKIYDPINSSKLQIFDSFGSIERIIENILSFYFFGETNLEKEPFIERFNSLILASSWCSFASKKSLLIHIINEGNILSGKQKEKYFKILMNCMSYRNRFAHGELSTDGRIVMIQYFEGKSKKEIIDQPLLDKIETDLNNCFKTTMEIAKTIGAYREH